MQAKWEQLNLLSLSLQNPSGISLACSGNFSAPKRHEIVVYKGEGGLELLRPDDTGRLISISTTRAFAVIRSIKPFRLAGSNRDYLIIGSDSGKISLIEFDEENYNTWKVVHCETYGRTGCRRGIPGEHLAVDPKGRAIMISSIEKQKFVYSMNRDNANRLTISSPLEAHKNETIAISTCGVDVGFENPIFAVIELNYSAVDKDPSGQAASNLDKYLTYYELDLGLNHMVRKWTEPISRKASLLLSVPGGNDGPSGVLICGENWVSYKHQGHPEVRTPLPRRQGTPPSSGLLVTATAMHKQKGLFFYIIQTELGDLYKVTLITDTTDGSKVTSVNVMVFDTITPANALCITRNGLLFAASEFGDHGLYHFQSIGDDNDSNGAITAVSVDHATNTKYNDDSIGASQIAPTFTPKSDLTHLLKCDEMISLASINDMIIADTAGEGSPQIHVLCGKGPCSSLRLLRHGLPVNELAVSELPGRPTMVWTIRNNPESPYHGYIVVSFTNATLVLAVGETVEEVTDSGLQAQVRTLEVMMLADGALVQVHAAGITHIQANKQSSTWTPPAGKAIEYASANEKQVIISLSGGEVIYFQLDEANKLIEMGSSDMDIDVTAVHIGSAISGEAFSLIAAVACFDSTVRLLSLSPSEVLRQKSSVVLSQSARADSLNLMCLGSEKDKTLTLSIGLSIGILQRHKVDPQSGRLFDARSRFVGGFKPIKLATINVGGTSSLLSTSSRNWLTYTHLDVLQQVPVQYEALEAAANFHSAAVPEGIVSISGNTLRIFSIEGLGSTFHTTSIPLKYTPRKACLVENLNCLVIAEAEHNSISENNLSDALEHQPRTGDGLLGPVVDSDSNWASCIRVIEAKSGSTIHLESLKDDEAALNVVSIRFDSRPNDIYIVASIAIGMSLHPKKMQGSELRVYSLEAGKLSLQHATEVEDTVLGMCQFKGMLAVGVGKMLRLYDMGKKKLLKKCENRNFPSSIVRLDSRGDRLYVGDLTESILFVKYQKNENVFNIFAGDTIPRFTTAMNVVDYNTVCGTDKFGSLFTLRLPEDSSDHIDDVNTSNTAFLYKNVNSGAAHNLHCLTHYYTGEIGTSLNRASLFPGKKEVLISAGVMGGIRAFLPLSGVKDIDFLKQLESFMGDNLQTLCGRNHVSYRSYFQPVKETIDGDLCEMYRTLNSQMQEKFAQIVNKTPDDVLKKLEDIRATIL